MLKTTYELIELTTEQQELLAKCVEEARSKYFDNGEALSEAEGDFYHEKIRSICQGREWKDFEDTFGAGRSSPRAEAWNKSLEFRAFKTLRLCLDQFKCTECNCRLTSWKKAHCHHIIYEKKRYPGLESLQSTKMMCEECHEKYETKKRDIKSRISAFPPVPVSNDRVEVTSPNFSKESNMKFVIDKSQSPTERYLTYIHVLAQMPLGTTFNNNLYPGNADFASCVGELRRFGFWVVDKITGSKLNGKKKPGVFYCGTTNKVTKYLDQLTVESYERLRSIIATISKTVSNSTDFVLHNDFKKFCVDKGWDHQLFVDNVNNSRLSKKKLFIVAEDEDVKTVVPKPSGKVEDSLGQLKAMRKALADLKRDKERAEMFINEYNSLKKELGEL